ncbi:MAG: hypothetical protein ACLURP_04275 [Ruminococcus sp.]
MKKNKGREKMIYRTEHPKPQFMRENWLNLNGSWDFEIDHGGSGEATGALQAGSRPFQKNPGAFLPGK